MKALGVHWGFGGKGREGCWKNRNRNEEDRRAPTHAATTLPIPHPPLRWAILHVKKGQRAKNASSVHFGIKVAGHPGYYARQPGIEVRMMRK